MVCYLLHTHHDTTLQHSFSCMVVKLFHGRLRACKIVYKALIYAAKQSIPSNPIILYSAPNVDVNRYLGCKIWIASRHRIEHYISVYRLAIDHETASLPCMKMKIAIRHHDVYEADSRPFCPFIFVL